MKRSTRHKLVVASLSLNAILLAFMFGMHMRGDGLFPAAMAQMPAGAAGRDLIVAPGQMSSNTWGCYVVDQREGTLCTYQYIPGEKMLRLQAARSISQDFGLRNFNTDPSPSQVAELVQKERSGQMSRPATRPAAPAR